MSKNSKVISLDVGEKRIGVAIGDLDVKIASPLTTIQVDGTEIDEISKILSTHNTDTIVVGYPRNQLGETTAQTEFVEEFANKLKKLSGNIIFQDESLTSVIAENRLKSYNRPYSKSDIDAHAATIILQDYIDDRY